MGMPISPTGLRLPDIRVNRGTPPPVVKHKM